MFQRKTFRIAFAGLGAFFTLLAFGADWIGLSANAGLGAFQLGLLGLGIVALIGSALPPGSRIAKAYGNLCLFGASTYLTLLACEVVLGIVGSAGPLKNPVPGLQGLYQPRRVGGYELVPNWEGYYDDGVVRTAIRTNSNGHRDREWKRSPENVVEVAIVGDSFAFGYMLDPGDRIDEKLEAASGGDIDAYNFGVPGYGPEDTLITFRENDWWRGSHVFYLMFHNDLRDDQPNASINTAFDGFIVKRMRADGKPYTDEELRQKVAESLAPTENGLKTRAIETLTLTSIRNRVRALADRQIVLSDGPPSWYSEESREAAVANCIKMREIAAARGAGLSVVYIPTKGEVALGEHAVQSADLIARARAAGLEVIELLGNLTTDHYFDHDMHFTASGAEQTAKILLSHVRSRPEAQELTPPR